MHFFISRGGNKIQRREMKQILFLLGILAFVALVQVGIAESSLRMLHGDEMDEEIDTLSLNNEKPAPQPKPKACWKEGESRGAGVLPEKGTRTCPVTHPEKSMGLCYNKCKNDKREGLGPLCWDNCSRMTYKANGIVFCCDSDDTCSQVSFLLLKNSRTRCTNDSA